MGNTFPMQGYFFFFHAFFSIYRTNRTQTDFDFDSYIPCIYYTTMGHAGESITHFKKFLHVFYTDICKKVPIPSDHHF